MVDPRVADAITQVEVQAILYIGAPLVLAIAGLAAWGLSLLRKKFNIDDKTQAGIAFESAIANGLNKGVAVVASKLANGIAVRDPHQIVTEVAWAYSEPKVQDEMKKLGIDPASLAGRIDARAAGKMLEPAVTAALNKAQLPGG